MKRVRKKPSRRRRRRKGSRRSVENPPKAILVDNLPIQAITELGRGDPSLTIYDKLLLGLPEDAPDGVMIDRFVNVATASGIENLWVATSDLGKKDPEMSEVLQRQKAKGRPVRRLSVKKNSRREESVDIMKRFAHSRDFRHLNNLNVSSIHIAPVNGKITGSVIYADSRVKTFEVTKSYMDDPRRVDEQGLD